MPGQTAHAAQFKPDSCRRRQPGPAPVKAVVTAYGRALRAQLTGRMLLLSLLPLLLSVALWGGVMWYGMQPLLDFLQQLFAEYGWFQSSSGMLATFGLGALKVILVPLVAILLLLPLMIGTALLFIGVAAMPAIERHVSARQFPQLEQKQGGTMLGSVWINTASVLLLAVLWLLTLPLYLFPPLAIAVQTALWGWATARVMSYDALAAHASPAERAEIMRRHRWPLLAIGMASGAAGALPGIAWIGGAVLSFVLFPVLALLSIWLYIIIFLFTGLWFQYYCLQALADLRAGATLPDASLPAQLNRSASFGEPGL